MLSDLTIRKIAPPEKGVLQIPDSRVDGLWLRVYPNGRKIWALRKFRTGLGRIRKTYGPYPSLSLQEARKIATVDLGILASGGDPRSQVSAAPLVRELLEAYSSQHLPSLKPSSRREYSRIIDKELLPALGERHLAEVDKMVVAKALAKIEPRGRVLRNRTQAILSSAYSWASQSGWNVSNPCYGLKLKTEAKRRRVLSDDELPAAWEAMKAYRGVAGRALQLMLLTGQRGGEVRRMRWEDLREDAGGEGGIWWTIPETKNGRPHSVYLTPMALEILDVLDSGGRGWVFAAKNARTHLDRNVLPRAAARINKALEAEATWTPHDLRRTVETSLARLGVDPFVVDRITNHSVPGIRDRYNQWSYLPERKDAILRWDTFLQRILAKET
ncbi:MAG: tyrosine-type recombinase/integrase [Deltaproteobacteria bacterium]|nr:tyrosine-type recombinase/integrase [Deltaproteobacteria bacterium]